MDRTNLSKLERGTYPYSQKTLEAAAKAYGCKPEDILLVNPLLEGEPIDVDELGDLAELLRALPRSNGPNYRLRPRPHPPPLIPRSL